MKITDFSPEDVVEKEARAEEMVKRALEVEAGVEVTPESTRMWRLFGGLGSHDLSVMREVLGMPERVVGSSLGFPEGLPAASLGWGVPMSSGGGEPATEERGVVSPSPLAPRWAGRPRGRGLEGVAVARGVPRGLAGFTGAATTVEGMFCLAYSTTASCACEMGSLGRPSYRSRLRGTSLRRPASLSEWSKIWGLKKP